MNHKIDITKFKFIYRHNELKSHIFLHVIEVSLHHQKHNVVSFHHSYHLKENKLFESIQIKFEIKYLQYLSIQFHLFLHLHYMTKIHEKIDSSSMPIIAVILLYVVLHVFVRLLPNIRKIFVKKKIINKKPFLVFVELLFHELLLHVLSFLLRSFDVVVVVHWHVDLMDSLSRYSHFHHRE
jgi:hypothetical protein